MSTRYPMIAADAAPRLILRQISPVVWSLTREDGVKLPAHMWARIQVVAESGACTARIQARSPHARRETYYHTFPDAAASVMRWARRVIRERLAETHPNDSREGSGIGTSSES